jgi:hypothetical protein
MLDGFGETVTVGVEGPDPPPLLPPHAVKQRHTEKLNQIAACRPPLRIAAPTHSFIAFIGVRTYFPSLRRIDCPRIVSSR